MNKSDEEIQAHELGRIKILLTQNTYSLFILIISFITVPFLLFFALIGRTIKRKVLTQSNISIVWGTISLTNYKHWSNALARDGWNSKSVVGYASTHFSLGDFGEVLFRENDSSQRSKSRSVRNELRNLIQFEKFIVRVLLQANLIMTSCEGFIFYQYNRGLFNYKVEYFLLRLAKIKIGVIPYGGDAHIYRRIQNPKWLAGLLTDYPKQALIQNDISERVDFYVEKADIFLPGSAIFDGFGRADRISANTLCIDTDLWSPTSKSIRKTIVISHTPNHRKIKGTQLIIEAVSQLKAEGFNVELKLIEGKSNEDVRIALQGSSDIHIDQLNSDCYGLSAIESMALGIPTLSSFGGAVREFFNEWSFSKNCPIVDINSGTLLENLRTLIENDNYRDDLSIRSRQYVLDYHSYEYFARFFEEILESKSIILKSNGTFK